MIFASRRANSCSSIICTAWSVRHPCGRGYPLADPLSGTTGREAISLRGFSHRRNWTSIEIA